jgi:preprotein translocase subunit Sss1
MEEKEKEIKVEEKKSFKEKLDLKKEKAKSWWKEHRDVAAGIGIMVIGTVGGFIAHAVLDDAINGGKTIAWYDHYKETPDQGTPNMMVFTRTPTIREIKRGSIEGKVSAINTNQEDIDTVFPEAKED